MLSALPQFICNWSQYVVMDGCCSNLVNVVSGVPQFSVLGPLLFLLYTSGRFSVLQNNLYAGYADDSTLVAIVPSTLTE